MQQTQFEVFLKKLANRPRLLRVSSMALVTCLSLCTSVRAADLVGTWIAPAPNAFYFPGQKLPEWIEQNVNVRWEELQLRNVRSVRDLWCKSNVGNLPDGYEGTLPVHGAVLLKVGVTDSARSSP